MTAFHGQYWNRVGNQGQWRITAQESPDNDREEIYCPDDDGYGLWYIGGRLSPPETDNNDITALLQLWGEMIYAQGYVDQPGLRMIIDPPAGGAVGPIDPSNPGELSRGGRGSQILSGRNPYRVNFLIDRAPDGWSYDFDVAAPPTSREYPNS